MFDFLWCLVNLFFTKFRISFNDKSDSDRSFTAFIVFSSFSYEISLGIEFSSINFSSNSSKVSSFIPGNIPGLIVPVLPNMSDSIPGLILPGFENKALRSSVSFLEDGIGCAKLVDRRKIVRTKPNLTTDKLKAIDFDIVL